MGFARVQARRSFEIGGVLLEHHEGLAGHSDGDVLLHAITDALLGAIAAADIGTLFPPNDPQWKGADSAMFLHAALDKVEEAGLQICNVDTTLVMAAPKISPVAEKIRENVAALLCIAPHQVGIKAKTPEGLKQDHVAIAHAVVLLDKGADEKRMEMAAAALESQSMVDDAVRDVVSDVALGTRMHSGATKLAPWDTEDIT